MNQKADFSQVICVKCGQSKDDNLAATCGCGGSYRTSLNRGEGKTRLKMIKSGEFTFKGKGSYIDNFSG